MRVSSSFCLSILTLCVLLSMGCSALLDPYNCESNSDCNGGVCVDGICVGDEQEPDQMLDPDVEVVEPDATSASDAMVADSMRPIPDMAPDMRVEPDMRVNTPPECSLMVGTDLTSEPTVEISIIVSDGEDDSTELDVTLNGSNLNINRMGTYLGRFPLDEGANEITLRAVDTSGIAWDASATVYRDSTPPVLSITDPPVLNDLLTNVSVLRIQGSLTDDNFVDQLDVEVDEIPVDLMMPIIWDGQDFELSIALQSGFQIVSISGVDAVGNRSDLVEIEVEVDDQPPTIELTSPQVAAITTVTQRRFQVRGVLRDQGNSVRNPMLNMRISAGAEMREYPDIRGNISGEFSQFVELFNGSNLLTVCGFDDAGNESCVDAEIVKNEPCVTIDSPAEGAYVGAERITVEGSVCEGVSSLNAVVGDRVPTEGSLLNGLRFRVELNQVADGEQNIVVTASNVDGDSAQDAVTVNVDSSAPTVSFRSPEANDCVGAEVTVVGTAVDMESGLATVSVNGQGIDAFGIDGIGGEFRQVVTIDGGERQRDQITVVATNRAGLSSEVSTFVQVDTVAPLISFDILNVDFRINPWLKPDGTGRVSLTGSLDVGQCGIAQGGFQVEGLVPNLDNNGGFELRGFFEDGQHNLVWSVRDIVGNVREGNYGFRVDSIAPMVEFTSPTDGSFQTEERVRIAGTITETGSGVEQVSVNGRLINFVNGLDGVNFETFSDELAEGPNTLIVDIRDQVGNQVSHSFTVHRDTSAPAVELSEPNIGVAVPLPLTVTGTASDAQISQAGELIAGSGIDEITVNGVVANFDSESGQWVAYGVTVDSQNPIVRVSARDVLGNEITPIERAVQVRDYGFQDPVVDGIDLAGDTAHILVADLNNDGRPDLVSLTASEDGQSGTFIQGVNGGFSGYTHEQASLPAASSGGAAVGDVDSDGQFDLVVTDSRGSQLLLGNGFGQFVPSPFPLASLGDGTRGILGDGTRDSRLDLLIYSGETIRYYFGDGDTTFSLAEDPDGLGMGSLADYAKIDMQDVDADGVLDFVALDSELGGQIWFGQRDNTFTRSDAGEWVNAVGHTDFVWIDANRDGALDIFAFGGAQNRFFLNNGQAQFVDVNIGQIASIGQPSVVVADMNGDGRDDLVVGDVNGSQLYENGPAGFNISNTVLPQFGAVKALAAHDVDSDGDFDLIVGTSAGLRIIRSNLSQLNPAHQFTHIQGYRKRNPAGLDPPLPFENHGDALGTRLFVQYLDEDEIDNQEIAARPLVPQRTVVLEPASKTLVTFGDRAGLRLKMTFIDVGNQGQNSRTLNGLRPQVEDEDPISIYSPE
ncbi:MAG: FG-GAP-like repeat-containing protein [Myxococcota bacterium]|nr:FG-GAP-like repeat-containing protein [Myxococcota bacterium]